MQEEFPPRLPRIVLGNSPVRPWDGIATTLHKNINALSGMSHWHLTAFSPDGRPQSVKATETPGARISADPCSVFEDLRNCLFCLMEKLHEAGRHGNFHVEFLCRVC